MKIYTTTNCPACKMTKKQFDAASIPYEEIHVGYEDEAVRSELKEMGFSSFPVVIHDSGVKFAGFNVGMIRQIKSLEGK